MTTSLDRRSLLAGSLVLGAGSLALPRIAFAQGAGSRNLLFVLLRGAADGMAMLAPVGDPGFAALRGGQVVGEHTLLFAAASEHISLTHRSFDRRVYATGAVRAALWVHGRAPALYGMKHVLGM